MHREAMEFIKRAAPQPWTGGAVLEIGSRNVNGSPRQFMAFDPAHYVGIDRRAGIDVDIVVDAADYDGVGAFGLVICAEVLEHEPNPQAVIDCAWRALRPGGLLVLTCAGPGRAAHSCDGRPELPEGEHYQNIGLSDLRDMLAAWQAVVVTYNPEACDLYATAVKP